jgi:hypothetical protein
MELVNIYRIFEDSRLWTSFFRLFLNFKTKLAIVNPKFSITLILPPISLQIEIVRHCYYPAAQSDDPHLRLRDDSGVSEIEGVGIEEERERELRMNAGM